VTARAIAEQGLRLSSVAVDGDVVYWLEGRPGEGGRNALVRRRPDGVVEDVTPPAFNVRTRVHEYGGGAYLVDRGDIVWSNFADQRLYHIRASAADEPPRALTPEGACFYADAVVDRARGRLICVREDHRVAGREPINTLVAIPLSGAPSEGEVIAAGYDFYSTPRLSPDGSALCWICWRHPRMPWDGTELWVAGVRGDGGLEPGALIAGGDRESIYQPGWTGDGTLYFASDRDGWWRLYRVDGVGSHFENRNDSRPHYEAVLREAPPDAEFGRPQWVFGTATWAAAGPDRLAVAYTSRGQWQLATIDTRAGTLADVAGDLEPHDWLTATSTHAVLVAASPRRSDAVMRVDLADGHAETLRASSTLVLDPASISTPEAIEFPTAPDRTAHAFYYAPRSAAHAAAADERPPLIVISHGGPTTATQSTLDPRIQFWTSRGFAVVDVNYGGSSGYGRAYRERLNGEWGVTDVADVVNAARYLVAQGKADRHRLIVRGGSAGGYTTLAALTFQPDVFKAGASYYGISDLEVLARDTHKFESRYLDSMIGPYPELKEVYRTRSPIHYVDRLACALILLQGLDDKVVPPNQSQMMADAVRSKGWPVAYLTFEGEQHGFRKAATIVRSLEAELFFYAAVFGFSPADPIDPIPIDNLPSR
jgi:dipeptidyl aminopeptidase/acylaminoacyl peptidase